MGASGFFGATGPQGATGVRMIGPAGPTGPTGPAGFRGTTGAVSDPPRETYYPSKEGKTVFRVALADDAVEIRCMAWTSVGWRVFVDASAVMTLYRDGMASPINTWELRVIMTKDPGSLADSCRAVLANAEISLSPEELVAMFTMVRREIMKMVAVVTSELFISDLSREEMAESWDAANVLRVMQE